MVDSQRHYQGQQMDTDLPGHRASQYAFEVQHMIMSLELAALDPVNTCCVFLGCSH